MKKFSDLCTLMGFAVILCSAGVSDTEGEMRSVIKLLLIGVLIIVFGRMTEFLKEFIEQNKKVRRSKEWRRAKIKEQSYFTF